MKTGKLIAIEGIDGSGKGTQARLLVDALRQRSIPVSFFCFPQYGHSFFGQEVGKYLHGEYGGLESVNPKFSALLYALDRYQARDAMLTSLRRGDIVVCDRYTSSNMAHQSARAAASEMESVANWISHVEHDILGLPKADLTVLLQATVEQSQRLVGNKEKRSYTDKSHDLQEASPTHLALALAQFLHLAERDEWVIVNCLDGSGSMRSPQSVHEELFRHVIALLS